MALTADELAQLGELIGRTIGQYANPNGVISKKAKVTSTDPAEQAKDFAQLIQRYKDNIESATSATRRLELSEKHAADLREMLSEVDDKTLKEKIEQNIRTAEANAQAERLARARAGIDSKDLETRRKAQSDYERYAAKKKKVQNDELAKEKRRAADRAEKGGKHSEAKKLRKEANKLDRQTARADRKAKRLEDFVNGKTGYQGGPTHIEKLDKYVTAAMKGKLGEAIHDAVTAGINVVNDNIKDIVSHRTKTMARLQGFRGDEFDYDNVVKLMKINISTSPYITQQKYLQNLDKAVEKGIAYNIEERTFLATISEKISNTFDVFNSELLRLIKLQQADSTKARMGMEAAIQKGLNSMFEDSSYTTNLYQTVSGHLLGAESLMTRDAAVEFEYQVQKWLGSLYSLGISDSAITDIATAINSIGTGDVTALAGTKAQTLMAMSSQRAGVDYADALVNGLNASDTNKLLRAMVEYLQQIAIESGNNVVRSAYKDIYSLSLADMKAISSLTGTDIDTIFNSTMNYKGAENSLNTQISNISKRMSLAEMANNVIENFKYTVAAGIADNPVTYTLWAVTDLVRNATGGIHLPHMAVMGNTIDLSAFTVENIMQGALMGYSTITQIGSMLSALFNGLPTDMSVWGGTETTSRGGFVEQTAGFSKSLSMATYVGGGSGEDMKNTAISGATEDAQDVADITNANVDTEHTFDEFYEALFVDGQTIPVSLESIGKNGDEQLAQLVGLLLNLQDLTDNTKSLINSVFPK